MKPIGDNVINTNDKTVGLSYIQTCPEKIEIITNITEDKKIPGDIQVEIVKSNKEDCQKNVEGSRGWRQYTGLILSAMAALFFSVTLVLVKKLHVYHPFSLSVWRQLGNIVPSIPMVLYFRYYRKRNIFDQVWPPHTEENRANVFGMAVRGFFGATALILKFYALDYLTIADMTVITYSSPIFIVIMAHFFLKEKCGVTPIIVGIWTVLGVVLIARPPFFTGQAVDNNILVGTCIILSSVLCQSAVVILVRKIREIHFSVMTLAFGLWGFCQSLIVAYSFGVFSYPEGFRDIGLTALLGILSFFGQMCTITSLQFEQAGPVSLIRASDVIFAFLWQILFLDILPDMFSILGAIVVMIGVIVTATRKWVGTLPKDSPKRNALSCLLR